MSVDLSQPIPITVTTPEADSVTLGLDILGTSVGRHQVGLTGGPTGHDVTVPAPVNRHLLAGTLPAKITVLQGNTTLGSYRFTTKSTQRSTMTVAAGATILLALLAAAYLESNLRVLRRGRESVPALFAAALSAAVLGVVAVASAWVFLGHPPSVGTLAWTAALAAAAGVIAAVGARRVGGSRRRLR